MQVPRGYKNPEILYDFAAWRFIDKQFPEIFAENKTFPKVRYSQTQTHPFNDPSKVLLVNYSVEFISSGYAILNFVFNDPITGVERRQTINAEVGHYFKKIIWRFICTFEGKECQKKIQALWIGTLGRLSCQNCARVRRFAKTIEFHIAEFRRDPSYLVQVLSNPNATEKKKRYALIALEKLTNKFKKMTRRWETLNETEKKYYEKLIPVIFSKSPYRPSSKLSGELAPFQTNF